MESWLEPILDADGMRAADSWAIEARGVPSLRLMETAGAALAAKTAEVARGSRAPIRVVCGKGNNGGDGVVAARLLAELGHPVDLILLWPADELSEDSGANLARYKGEPIERLDGAIAADLEGSAVVIDAIFGTGFSGSPRAPADAAIAAMNACGAPIVSADMPSGVDGSTGEADGEVPRCAATVTFHGAKVGHWIDPGKSATGRLEVAEIGIPKGDPAEPAAGLIRDGVLELAPLRAAGGSKFASGSVVVIGGSRGLTGAVCMAAEAAGRAGAGYVSAVVPADLEPILEVKLTETMTKGIGSASGRLDVADAEEVADAAARADAVVVGPGLGRDDGSLALAREAVGRIEAPVLIDADGLNAHAERLDSLRSRTAPTVLTPHAGELGRLLGRDSSHVSAHRLESVREAARLSGAVVVLKGDDTIIADGERVAISRGGAPGLATAGTGDVLSGTIAALLARGVEPFAAACAGVHAHLRAGRIAAKRIGAAESVVATDVIAALPHGLRAGEGR
ncbi:NAD(P)H-hydrate dehydratase [Thermoleophilia bacterium SCSIO 60948]|nr:NAD(P)H-hydrate dehydratase [Thermoleophilia bacterium SCSIO 60948]